MIKLAEVCLTEESRGIAIFDVKIAYLPLTEITVEHEVIVEKDGKVCDMGTNRVVIKDQKGEHVFVKDSNRLKGVGRGRKANYVYDTLETALDMVDTEMLLGSFDSEIFESFYVTEETQETSNTETINTTTTETEEVTTSDITETEVTTSDITERSYKHKGNPSSNTDQNCTLEEKILTSNSLDDSVAILYNALVESRNDDLMENVFSLTELKNLFECQGMSQDEISQTLKQLSNSNTSYFIDVEGCNFRPITKQDLLDIIQKLHSNSQQKYIRKGSRYYETKVYEC